MPFAVPGVALDQSDARVPVWGYCLGRLCIAEENFKLDPQIW